MAGDPSSLIRLDAEFSSYAEFESIFNQWRTEDHHPMRIASSEMLKEVPREIQERFRYRYVTFNCMHFGVPRLRGSGKRSNQAYLPCGCKARVRLTYFPEEGKLRVSKFDDEHTGHTIISNEGSAKTRGRYLVALKQFIPYSISSPTGSGRCSPVIKTPVFDIAVQEKYVQQLHERQRKNYRIVGQRRAAKGLPVLDNEFPPIVDETVPVFHKLSDTEVMSPEMHKELTMVTYKLLRRKLLLHALRKEVDILSVLEAQPKQDPRLVPPSNQIAMALRAIPPRLPGAYGPMLDSIFTLPPDILASLARNPPMIPRSFPELYSHTTVTSATTVAPSAIPSAALSQVTMPSAAPSAHFTAPSAVPSAYVTTPSALPPALLSQVTTPSSVLPVLPPKSFQKKQFGTAVPNGYFPS